MLPSPMPSIISNIVQIKAVLKLKASEKSTEGGNIGSNKRLLFVVVAIGALRETGCSKITF